MKENKEKILGFAREALTALGSLMFATVDGWPSVVGLIVMALSIIWAIVYHEGMDVIYTSIRKALSAAPGVLVVFGLIDPDQAASAVALLLPLTSIVWSFIEKGGKAPKSGIPAIALIACLALLTLPSCHVIGSAITGQSIPSTSVQRAGNDNAPVIHISSTDLALAEQATEAAILTGQTPPVHGLYDAGYLAGVARKTVIEATK